ARAFPQLGLGLLPPGPLPAAGEAEGGLHGLHRRLGQNYRIFALPPDGDVRKLGIALPDGAMIAANLMPEQRRPPFLGGPWMMTPITRMRLRSEFIDDETHRARMLDDLDQMRSMLESVLSFLRNDRRLESMTLTDIASTLQLVTDQFADMGRKVAYDGPTHAMATARPDDLHRSVTNLVENAVRFGAEAV